MSATVDQLVCALGGIDASAQKSDTVNLKPAVRALFVGGPGDIKVTTLDGSVLVFTAVQQGILPVSVNRLWSTGTTATTIIGLF